MKLTDWFFSPFSDIMLTVLWSYSPFSVINRLFFITLL